MKITEHRYRLSDGTVWPTPDADEMTRASAYSALLEHPWGTETSIAKLRELRREVKAALSPAPESQVCPECRGDGYYVVDCSTENEMVQDTRECEACHGTGRKEGKR